MAHVMCLNSFTRKRFEIEGISNIFSYLKIDTVKGCTLQFRLFRYAYIKCKSLYFLDIQNLGLRKVLKMDHVGERFTILLLLIVFCIFFK